MVENFDVLIIGSGPAGFTAAIYASRASLTTLVLEGEQPGGQLTTTTEVENFPGFPEGIQGPQLMNNMREQAKRFGAQTKFEHVTKVDFSNTPFKVWVGDTLYESKSIIISTGARARYLGLPSEERLKGKGVSACATCDGFFFKDKEIIVVGGGDSAMEEANFLTRFASKVTLINRTENFRASPIMLERIKKNEKIILIANKQIAEVLGEEKVTGVRLKDSTSGEESELSADGMFLAIGHVPNTELFKEMLDCDKAGYLQTVPGTTKTQIEGVFAAGDVQDTVYRQGITAAGTGCMAALEAQKYLEHKEHEAR